MPTFNAGSIAYEVSADTSDVNKSLQDLEARFAAAGGRIGRSFGNSISSGLGRVGSGLQRLGTSVATFAANAARRIAQFSTAAAAAFAGFSLKAGIDLEKTRIAFTALTGDAEVAGQTLASLRQFAETTPFQFDDIAQAGQNLLAFGTAAEDVEGELKAIGDIAALTNQPISELAELYGKAQVQGRLFGEDINQLTGRGIPIIGELAEQFGVAESEVKELVASGAVGFPQLQQAFQSLTSEGGRFANGMEQLSLTVSGRLSTLRDRFISLGASILGISETGEILEGSLIDGLSRGIDTLLQAFEQIDVAALTARVTGIFQAIGSFIVNQFIPAVVSAFTFFRDNVLPILQTIATFLVATFGPVLRDIWTVVQTQIIPAFQRMAPTLRVIGVIIVGALIVALVAFAAALRVTIRVVGFLIDIFSRLVAFFQATLGPAIRFIAEIFRATFQLIKGIVTGDTNLIRQSFSTAFNAIRNLVITRLEQVSSFVQSILARIRGFFSGGLLQIISNVTGAFGRINSIAISLGAQFGSIVLNIITTVAGYFARLPGMILSALGNLSGLLLSAGSDIMTGLLNGITNGATAIFNKITEIASSIKDKFSGVLSILSPSRVFTGFGENIVEGLVIGLDNLAGEAVDTVAQLANRVSEQDFSVTPSITPTVGDIGNLPTVNGVPVATGVPSGEPSVVVVTPDFFNVLTEEQKRTIGEEIFEALNDDLDALGGLNTA